MQNRVAAGASSRGGAGLTGSGVFGRTRIVDPVRARKLVEVRVVQLLQRHWTKEHVQASNPECVGQPHHGDEVRLSRASFDSLNLGRPDSRSVRQLSPSQTCFEASSSNSYSDLLHYARSRVNSHHFTCRRRLGSTCSSTHSTIIPKHKYVVQLHLCTLKSDIQPFRATAR